MRPVGGGNNPGVHHQVATGGAQWTADDESFAVEPLSQESMNRENQV